MKRRAALALPALLVALLAAPAAHAAGAPLFNQVNIASFDTRAADGDVSWDLKLDTPVMISGDPAQTDSMDIVVLFPGTTDSSHPSYWLGDSPFVDFSVGAINGAGSSKYVIGFAQGDPVSGLQLHIHYAPNPNGWQPGELITFHLHHLINATTSGSHTINVLMKNLTTGFTWADSTPANTAITATSVSGFQVESYDPSAPGQPYPIPQQTAGVPIFLYIQAVDRYGNPADTTDPIALTDSTGTMGTLHPVLGGGAATQTGAVVTQATPQDFIKATDGVHTSLSNAFAVAPGPLGHFRFSNIPASVIANNPFTATIEAQDGFGNRVTGFDSNVIASDLTGTLAQDSIGPFVGGLWSGLLTVGDPIAADSVTVQYPTASGAPPSGTSPAFQVVPQTFSHFVFASPTGTATAGEKFPIRIRALDNNGYVYRPFHDAVPLTDDTGTLKPTLSHPFVLGVVIDSGSVTRATAADHVLADDGAGHSGNSSPFEVLAAAPAGLSLTGYPSTVQVGVPFPLTVAAQDAFGNVTSQVSGPAPLDDLTHTIQPGTTGAFSGGSWSGTVTLNDTLGADIISAQAEGAPRLPPVARRQATLTGESGPIRVVPLGLAGFTVTVPPGTQTAGVPFDATVSAVDGLGAVDTTFTGQVALAVDGPPPNGTALTTPFVRGVLTTPFTVSSAGSHSLYADDFAGHAGHSSPFIVVGAALAQFSVQARVPRDGLVAGVPFTVDITALDAFGNTVNGFSGLVQLADSTGTIQPAASGNFIEGSWEGTVTIGRGIPADRIIATFQTFPPGVSDPFLVRGETPLVLGIDPAIFAPGETTPFTLTGHFFEPSPAVSMGTGITVTGLSWISPDTLRGRARVAADAPLGTRTLAVSNFEAGDSAQNFFDVEYLPPVVTSLSRTSLAPSAHVGVLVVGHHFAVGAEVQMGVGVAVNSVGFVSPESLAVDVSVDSGADLGAQDVGVTTTHGTGQALGLLQIVPRPVVTSFDPPTGGGGLGIQVHGTGFERDVVPDSIRIGTEVSPATAQSAVLATFTVPPDALPGAQPTSILSFGAWSAPLPFTVIGPLRGDIDGDGQVTLSDIALAVGHIQGQVNLTGRQLYGADCDGNGSIDVLDVLCMVDAVLLDAPALLARTDIPAGGVAKLNAMLGRLELPPGTRAVAWRLAAAAAPGALNAGGTIAAWNIRGAYTYGVSAVEGAPEAPLPAGAHGTLDVVWADATGSLHRARVEAPAPPLRFVALGNPQRGAPWFGIPAHAAPARLELFTADGRRLAERLLSSAESGQFQWQEARPLAAGVYWARFLTPGKSETAKLLILP